jgi:hypothetical protein
MAQSKCPIFREEKGILEAVDATFGIPATFESTG